MSSNPLHILTINSGSSSLKAAVFRMDREERMLFSGALAEIGTAESSFHVKSATGETLVRQQIALPDHDAALQVFFDWMERQAPAQQFDAVGHRLVQGGCRHRTPQMLTPALRKTLDTLVPLAPDHLPQELRAIDAVHRQYPDLPQVACFDTAFHRDMPARAQRYALPRDLWMQGVMRYGFHGLSYEYIVTELRRVAGDAADGRLIIAHLGNGASMAAVACGRSLDTTMGLTPAGGLVMSTRPGDLDPGVPLFLLQELGMSPSAVNRLLNQQAGLLGISGLTSDMKELLDHQRDNPHATEAVELFCYQAKKYLGALAAVLGGLDTLIFTGGIGEQAAEIRRRICGGLAFLGIAVDDERNRENAPVISPAGNPVTIRVMPTNEELMIARHTCRVIAEQQRGQQAA